jgi:hypothetical protein
MGVVEDAIKIAKVGLDFKKQIDRFRGDYVRRRATVLNVTNPAFNAPKIATQIKAEMAVIQTYLASKQAIVDDTDTAPIRHLDLKIEAALVTVVAASETFQQRYFDALVKELRTTRADAIMQIVWRAAAIHGDLLWKTLGPPPQLQQAALDELLDRRLGAIEQMQFNVNSLGFGKGWRSWKVEGPAGPWRDGLRGRSFEYPSVEPVAPFVGFLPQMPDWAAYNMTTGGFVSYQPPNQAPPVRFPPNVAAAWRINSNNLSVTFQPSATVTPAAIMRELFTPREDYWDRSWLYCEHVGCLVNIQALRFGLHRRTGNDDDFNAVMRRPDYIELRPIVVSVASGHDFNLLMADDQDPFFENLLVDVNDLQVGDFVRFWNSRIYTMLPPYTGPWTSEFSLVMRLDLDSATGNVRAPLGAGPQVWLSGHGVHTVLYNAMATEVAAHLTSRFEAARQALPNAVDSLVDNQVVFRRWSPYEAFDPPGAWWVEIPEKVWKDKWGYKTGEEALGAVPRTVAAESGGQGYNAPHDSTALYFPLFEPALAQTPADGDSWRAYLRLRKANPQFRPASNTLKKLTIDGRLAQGLFYRGSKNKVGVVRPRVRP